MYDLGKCKIVWSFGSIISNGTIILENAVIDPVNLKNSINSFKKITRPRFPEKIIAKGLALKM